MMLLQCGGCKDSSESPRLDSSMSRLHPRRGSVNEEFGYQTLHTYATSSQSRCVDSPLAQSSQSSGVPDPYKSKTAALLWIESDESSMGHADGDVPNFQSFCPPHKWSAAFASPGDFTLKAAHVKRSHGTITYYLALIGLSIPTTSSGSSSPLAPTTQLPRSRTEGGFSPVSRKDKAQSVSIIPKTEAEITSFVHTMALRYPGHHVIALYSRKMQKARKLEARAQVVVEVLASILSITHVGLHRLIAVKEPVPQDLRVRIFLSLHLFRGTLPTGSNSCDGRLESQQSTSEANAIETRKPIPSEWLHPKQAPLPTRLAISSRKERRRSFRAVPCCTTYVSPMEWNKKAPETSGAFTVQITSIHTPTNTDSAASDVVQYIVTVLYVDPVNPSAHLTRTVLHRYADFWRLATHVHTKTKLDSHMHQLPPKTLFRSADPAFLEARAVGLQRFLDTLLCLSFKGMLDQKIDMAAEPQVRSFLELPPVQWNVVAEHPSKQDLDRFRALSNSSTASTRSISPLKTSDDEDEDDDDTDAEAGRISDERIFAEFESRVERPFQNRRSMSSQYYPVSRGVA
ncbi:hypothetical protein LEN26_013729 [Aphanomyces euteiches]|nr:hypothetical protein AeMF1_020322 [Aphanomyces euteiches]KAH9110552.1 hypothetical protein LEN26_013729 [Aphanomyces euteiches]KAH9196305.1 hypothetical protein AeNC1_001735 [Aphanomyces euteiches]